MAILSISILPVVSVRQLQGRRQLQIFRNFTTHFHLLTNTYTHRDHVDYGKIHQLSFINTPSPNLSFFNKVFTSPPSSNNYLTESNMSGHNLCKNSHWSCKNLMPVTFKYQIKFSTSAKCFSSGHRFSMHHSCIRSHMTYLSLITLCYIFSKSFNDSHYGLGRDMHI